MAKPLKIKRDFSCGGVVWSSDKDKVLLVQVKNLSGQTVWTFPKGHPEGAELDEAAAIREVEEETGWLCEIVKPVMDVQYSYVHKQVKVNKTVRWFLMGPVKQTGTFQESEILDCRWMDVAEAKRRLSYDSDQKLLKRVSLLV